MQVENKKIIVTGAASGIGKQLTKQLLKKGSIVIAVDINEDNLNELSKELNSEYLHTYIVDMGDDVAIRNFVKKILKEHLVVDGLINNAGVIQPFLNVENLDEKTIEWVMNINFNGPVLLTRLLLENFRNRPIAHIVNVSSMGGFFPFPGQTIYGASKAALKIFTEGLYAEYIGTNINVSVVFPGAIATDIAKNSNLETKETEESSGMKMTSASSAAKQIIHGMEYGKFQMYVGNDAKFMNFLYKLSPKRAINFIKKQMDKM